MPVPAQSALPACLAYVLALYKTLRRGPRLALPPYLGQAGLGAALVAACVPLCACVHLRAYYLGRDHLITVGEQPQTSEKSAQLVSVHISWGGAPVSSASA